MRIPDAYSAGFGQKLTPVTPAVMPDNSAAVQLGEAGIRMGNTLLTIAADQTKYERDIQDVQFRAAKAEEDRATREAQAEAKRAELQAQTEAKHLAQVQAGSAAELKFLDYGDYLGQAAQHIANNPDLKSPEDKQAAFQETANEVRSSFMQDLPDPLVQAQMEPHIVKATMGANKILNDTLAAKTADQIQANQVAALNSVTRSSRTLDEKIALIDSLDLSSYSQTQQVKIRDDARDSTTQTFVTERFSKEDPRKVLAELAGRNDTGEPIQYPWLDQRTRVALQGHASDLIKQQDNQRRMEAQQAAMLAEQKRRNTWDAIQDSVKAGFPIPAAVDVNLRKAFQGSQYEGLYSGLVQKANSFEHKQDLINQDPLTYYARNKGLNVAPIDMSQPLQPQLQQRVAIATETQKALGLPYKPILMAGEIKAVAQAMAKQDGQGRVQTGMVLGAMYGPQGAGYIAAQLAGGQGDVKDGILGLTVALAANGKSGAATLVATGSDFLKNEKTIYDATTKKGIADQFSALAGSAWKGYRTESRDAYQQGVTAAYTALIRMSGGDTAVFDKKLYQQAFTAVVGPTGYINKKTTVLPDGWTEDKMLNSLKQLSPDTVTRSGGALNALTGKPMDATLAAKRIRTEGSLWEAGNDGTYYVQLDGRQVMTPDGRPFRLSFGGTVPVPVAPPATVPQRTTVAVPVIPQQSVDRVTPPEIVHPKIQKYTAQIAELSPKLETLQSELTTTESAMEAARGNTSKYPQAELAYKAKKKELATTHDTIQQLQNGIQGYRDYPNRD